MGARGVKGFAPLLVFGLLSSPALANCTDSIMPVFQCGFASWFGRPPAGSGQVTAVWWQLGYGNSLINNGAGATGVEGTGMGPADTFSGNDSGLSTTTGSHPGGAGQPGVTLTPARDVLPQYAEAIAEGSLCSNFENSWAGVGIDGCADNPRTTAAADDDNLLNPYWGAANGYCPDPYDCAAYYTTAYQIDYPLAFLVRESTNRFFALAFVASKARVQHPGSPDPPASRAADITENFFDLATVINGDPNPVTTGPAAGRNNIIPWQPVPVPVVRGMEEGPPVVAHLSWNNVRVIHDGSTRPSARMTAPLEAGGVGVLDQGPLVRYLVEGSPLDPSDPNAVPVSWTALASLPAPSGPTVTWSHEATTRLAVRVRTLLGKTPRTAAAVLEDCRLGACGDLGFEATDCTEASCAGPPPYTVVDPAACAADADGDGVDVCHGDCDDADPAIRPGGQQVCDGINNDCLDPEWPAVPANEADPDGDAWSVCAGDCQEGNPSIHPGAAEACNGVDDDCSGEEDDDASGIDTDGDASRNACDCDDANPAVRPGAAQLCDGINNDCLDPAWPAIPSGETDPDGDAWSVCAGDCQEGNPAVHPGAVDVCNGNDDDCSGAADDDAFGIDSDGDASRNACDCDDANPAVRPRAPQICDGLNNDCLDPAWPAVPANEADTDGDTWRACSGDCLEGNPSVHPGALDICNGVDDDCTGKADDDALGLDSDGDLVRNACDNCRQASNPAQTDSDNDARGDACDNCISHQNFGQEDRDADQRGDRCDNCPDDANTLQDDGDQDGAGDVCDNCPQEHNLGQENRDGDGQGDDCDVDDGFILTKVLDASIVKYQLEAGSVAFHVYRGDMSVLGLTGIYTQDPALTAEAARFCSQTSGVLFEPFTPAVGAAIYYLVSGVDAMGIEGSLGTDSAGLSRPNDNPCP